MSGTAISCRLHAVNGELPLRGKIWSRVRSNLLNPSSDSPYLLPVPSQVAVQRGGDPGLGPFLVHGHEAVGEGTQLWGPALLPQQQRVVVAHVDALAVRLPRLL